MRGVAAEFAKPLLPIDGVPLVCRAVDLAYAAGVEVPIIVAAPENVNQIEEALGPNRDAAFVIQRAPFGPGDALLLGLRMRVMSAPSDRVLVLLSDNVSTVEDVAAVASHETAVGVKEFNREDALRFTWLVDDSTWIEDKLRQPQLNRTAGRITCWVGPFIGWRPNMENVLGNLRADYDPNHGELLIGPYLGMFMRNERNVTVPVSSYDVGTVESYLGVEK